MDAPSVKIFLGSSTKMCIHFYLQNTRDTVPSTTSPVFMGRDCWTPRVVSLFFSLYMSIPRLLTPSPSPPPPSRVNFNGMSE